MFSISAINDTSPKDNLESLAPTKEAQEFHLSKIYHEGLLKLQEKDYEKARELLESILEDSLITSIQMNGNATSGHLLQLSFLALKNLATVFCKLGPNYRENALRCFLQAVEIDAKDSVLWNQLGTFSCSVGLLSISRWAFEQGLICSPKNWNFMEKLLEILIAIGDEVACLSVAELILSHWPSHSRALHVKTTIEDINILPFFPRGIDRLQPKNPVLTFVEKRAVTTERIEDLSCKRLKSDIEVHLSEISWSAITDEFVEILKSYFLNNFEPHGEKVGLSSNARLTIHLPFSDEQIQETASSSDLPRRKRSTKEMNSCEEPPQERRSTRLERLRNRKHGKEEAEFSATRNVPVALIQCLQPFLSSGFQETFLDDVICHFLTNPKITADLSDNEYADISRFISDTSENHGVLHMGHLLLEELAVKCPPHQDSFFKILQLEKLGRDWGQERTAECELFLAELYYDYAIRLFNTPLAEEFISEASYHICKIIELISLKFPFHSSYSLENINNLTGGTAEASSHILSYESYFLDLISSASYAEKCIFWVRFFWLSGQLSGLESGKENAHAEFCASLSFLLRARRKGDFSGVIMRPYCKLIKEMTKDRILYDINLLKVENILDGRIDKMLNKGMLSECMDLLTPLVLSRKHVYPDILCKLKSRTIELSSLEALIHCCERKMPLDVEMCLNSHSRKLQILLAVTNVEGLISHIPVGKLFCFDAPMINPLESLESSMAKYNDLIAEEVHVLFRLVSQVKNLDSRSEHDSLSSVVRIVLEIQFVLAASMSNTAAKYLSKNSAIPETTEQVEEKQRCCFVNAAIAFCKFQHLVSASIKTQVDLMTVMHELLAEYGLCCAGKDDRGEEGTFLKFAIKHLLALDVKLKSGFKSNGLTVPAGSEEVAHNNDEIITSMKGEVLNLKPGKIVAGLDNLENISQENMVIKDTFSQEGAEDKLFLYSTDDDSVISRNGYREGNAEDNRPVEYDALIDEEREELELTIDNALDQCFFCLYGLNIRSEPSYEDDLVVHKNTNRGDYQTKEQCADVFQYILPFVKTLSRTRLVKLRGVLRAIRKHFPQPPEDVLASNPIEKFLEDPAIFDDELSEAAGAEGFLDSMKRAIFPFIDSLDPFDTLTMKRSGPYSEVYFDLYYLLAQSEDTSAIDKWAGFIFTKEGEEFVEQNANLCKYDLLYNPLRFESWQRLANIYDEEVDLLLNDGSKHINVTGWWNNATLPQRVVASRRRSKRCLLMSLALAETPSQQSEIHELLALVYYDNLQNVVPQSDQRSTILSKDASWNLLCWNSMKHFKAAYEHMKDWSHAFYLGKLFEKSDPSNKLVFAYFDEAISLNPSSVDAIYRMHASRIKLLVTCGIHHFESLKIVNAYSFSLEKKELIASALEGARLTCSETDPDAHAPQMDMARHILFDDCLAALQSCVEGDLKHFHKARYAIAKALHMRRENGDLERARDELSFCFRSSRSSFAFNMWEIDDGLTKKVRRRTPGIAVQKKSLEVNLPESSRKFISCLRKYILLYLKLLEETCDTHTLDRAYTSIRSDKRFSVCLEDLVPVTVGIYMKTLVSAVDEASEHLWEKVLSLFMEHWSSWPEICLIPECAHLQLSESSVYRCVNGYMEWLEKNGRLETMEGAVDKMRKRLKNLKISGDGACHKLITDACNALGRLIVLRLASVTPAEAASEDERGGPLLLVDLQADELRCWGISDDDHDRRSMMMMGGGVVVRRWIDKGVDMQLLRYCYNFCREGGASSHSSLSASALRLRVLSSPSSATHTLALTLPLKLLLWAYALVHGHYAPPPAVLKYFEENVKLKLKKAVSDMGRREAETPLYSQTEHTTPTPEAPENQSILSSYN